MKTGLLYRILQSSASSNSPRYAFIRRPFSPPKVKVFIWTLVQNRIHHKQNLLKKKKIVTNATCEVCNAWGSLGVHIEDSHSATCPWEITPPPLQSPLITTTVSSTYAVWKHRNEVVFHNNTPSVLRLRRQAKDEACLWSFRLRQNDLSTPIDWCPVLDYS